MKKAYVFKRQTGLSEQFDPVKLHASVVAACRSVRAPEGEAHVTAEYVVQQVIDWLVQKTEVTSGDIRRIAGTSLSKYQPEAGYLYEHHEMIA